MEPMQGIWNLFPLGENGKALEKLHDASHIQGALLEVLQETRYPMLAEETAQEKVLRGGGFAALAKRVESNSEAHKNLKRKIALLGKSRTGKSSLVNYLVDGSLMSDDEYDDVINEAARREGRGTTDLPWCPGAGDSHQASWPTSALKHAKAGDKISLFLPNDAGTPHGWSTIAKVIDVDENQHKIQEDGLPDRWLTLTDKPELMSEGTVLARRWYNIPTSENEPPLCKPDIPSNERSIPLLAEGDELHTTLRPASITYGRRFSVKIYYKCEAEVGEALQLLLYRIRNGEFPKQETASEKQQEKILEKALHFIGRQGDMIEEVAECDVCIPQRLAKRLGMMRTYTPGADEHHSGHLKRHRAMIQEFLCQHTMGSIESDEVAYGEPCWALVHKVVLEVPASVLKWHDIVDLPGFDDVDGFVGDGIDEELNSADYIIVMVDSTTNHRSILERLRQAGCFNRLVRPVLGSKKPADEVAKERQGQAEEPQKSYLQLAMVMHGDKAWPHTATNVRSTALVPGHPHNTEKFRGRLWKAEKTVKQGHKWEVRKLVQNALSSLLGSSPPTGLADQVLDSFFDYIILYTRLGDQVDTPIPEAKERTEHLCSFLRRPVSGEATASTAEELLEELQANLRTFQRMCEDRFRLVHFNEIPRKLLQQLRQKGKLDHEEFEKWDWKSFQEGFLEKLGEEYEAALAPSAKKCTDIQFGLELAKLAWPDEEDLPPEAGKVPASAFTGSLKRKLNSLEPLLQTGEWMTVEDEYTFTFKLAVLMGAPVLHKENHPIPTQLVLGWAKDETAQKVAEKGTDEVSRLFEVWRLMTGRYQNPLDALDSNEEDAGCKSVLLESLDRDLKAQLYQDMTACMQGSHRLVATRFLTDALENKVRQEAQNKVLEELPGKGPSFPSKGKHSRLQRLESKCQEIGEYSKTMMVEIVKEVVKGWLLDFRKACRKLSKEHQTRLQRLDGDACRKSLAAGVLIALMRDYKKSEAMVQELAEILNRSACNSAVEAEGGGPDEEAGTNCKVGGVQAYNGGSFWCRWTFSETSQLLEASKHSTLSEAGTLSQLQEAEVAPLTDILTSAGLANKFTLDEARAHLWVLGKVFETRETRGLDVARGFFRDERNKDPREDLIGQEGGLRKVDLGAELSLSTEELVELLLFVKKLRQRRGVLSFRPLVQDEAESTAQQFPQWPIVGIQALLKAFCDQHGGKPEHFNGFLALLQREEVLPDGWRVEYKTRRTGLRRDKYYVVSDLTRPYKDIFQFDSYVKAKRYFDLPRSALSLPCKWKTRAYDMPAGLEGEVKKRLETEGWRQRKNLYHPPDSCLTEPLTINEASRYFEFMAEHRPVAQTRPAQAEARRDRHAVLSNDGEPERSRQGTAACERRDTAADQGLAKNQEPPRKRRKKYVVGGPSDCGVTEWRDTPWPVADSYVPQAKAPVMQGEGDEGPVKASIHLLNVGGAAGREGLSDTGAPGNGSDEPLGIQTSMQPPRQMGEQSQFAHGTSVAAPSHRSHPWHYVSSLGRAFGPGGAGEPERPWQSEPSCSTASITWHGSIKMEPADSVADK